MVFYTRLVTGLCINGWDESRPLGLTSLDKALATYEESSLHSAEREKLIIKLQLSQRAPR